MAKDPDDGIVAGTNSTHINSIQLHFEGKALNHNQWLTEPNLGGCSTQRNQVHDMCEVWSLGLRQDLNLKKPRKNPRRNPRKKPEKNPTTCLLILEECA